MVLLAKIGFLPVRIWDLLDILIVGYLMYLIYRLLKGNIAFSIFIGLMTVYVAWWLVDRLKMDLLSNVLEQFVKVGVIIIVIIFQQEIRNFLLLLGKSTLEQRTNFLTRLFVERPPQEPLANQPQLEAIRSALLQLSAQHLGALVVLSKGANLDGLIGAGTALDALVSTPLLVSLFQKNSPLHDGAILIRDGRIHAAGCVLPLSENTELPQNLGLRHRAALGVAERLDVAAWIVSEETGHIALAWEGKLHLALPEADITSYLQRQL